jgi:hypothetical protein
VTVRIPHALVGALCLGFALANLVRPAVVPALGLAVVFAFGLAASDSRFRALALASAVVAVAWGWGSARLAQLDRSVLSARIGTAEWAVIEVEEPPRAGAFDQRMKALVLRWGPLAVHEPVLLQLPLGRSPPQGARLRLLGELRAPPGPSNGFDEAKWLRRRGSTRFCAVSRSASSVGAAASPVSAIASDAGSSATRRRASRASVGT